MLSRAGLAGAAAAASAAATQAPTAHARVAPPPAATATATAPAPAHQQGAKTAPPLLTDEWEVLDHDAAVPLFSPAQLDAAAADLQELIGGGGRAHRRRGAPAAVCPPSSDGDGGGHDDDGGSEGRAADAVIRCASGLDDDGDGDRAQDGGALLALRAHLPGALQMRPVPGGGGGGAGPVGAVVGAAARLLRDNPAMQASIEGAVARDPELVAMMARAVYGGGGSAAAVGAGEGALLVLGGGSAQRRRRHEAAAAAALLPASESDDGGGEEAGETARAKSDGDGDYNPFDPLASLGHHLSRFGAWLRAKVVDPLLGLADMDEDEDVIMGAACQKDGKVFGKQQEAANVDATAAAAAPPAYRHRARSAAEDEVRSAADAWLGALTAAMVAIVMLAVLRRPAAARQFVRAAMRGFSAAAAGRR